MGSHAVEIKSGTVEIGRRKQAGPWGKDPPLLLRFEALQNSAGSIRTGEKLCLKVKLFLNLYRELERPPYCKYFTPH